MGKQVNFYMTNEDETAFLSFVRSDRCVCILPERMPSGDVLCLEGLPDRSADAWFQVWLWDREHCSRPCLKYVEKQKHYVVDFLTSEVIQFSRSYYDEQRLVRGRIWAEFKLFDLNHLGKSKEKSASFVKWFNRLAGWIRRTGLKNEVGDYLLPAAVKYVAAGGRLAQFAASNHVRLAHHASDGSQVRTLDIDNIDASDSNLGSGD